MIRGCLPTGAAFCLYAFAKGANLWDANLVYLLFMNMQFTIRF